MNAKYKLVTWLALAMGMGVAAKKRAKQNEDDEDVEDNSDNLLTIIITVAVFTLVGLCLAAAVVAVELYLPRDEDEETEKEEVEFERKESGKRTSKRDSMIKATISETLGDKSLVAKLMKVLMIKQTWSRGRCILHVVGTCTAIAFFTGLFFVAVFAYPMEFLTWSSDTLGNEVGELGVNVDVMVVFQGFVQTGANPGFIFMQFWCLCGRFPGFTEGSTLLSPKLQPGELKLVVANLAYLAWVIVAPIFLKLRWWYYWIDNSIGFMFIAVEALHAYVMIRKSDISSGKAFPGRDVHEDLDRRLPAWVIFVVNATGVVVFVYVVIPFSIYGWMGVTTNFFAASPMQQGVIIVMIEALWDIVIPVVRAFLDKFSPMPDVANMILVLHPQLHKAISKRMLLSNIGDLETLLYTTLTTNCMEIVCRLSALPARRRILRWRWGRLSPKAQLRYDGGVEEYIVEEESPLYFLSRMFDEILETMFIIACPIVMYIYQKESIVFTFAGDTSVAQMLASIGIQLALELLTDGLALTYEVFMGAVPIRNCWNTAITFSSIIYHMSYANMTMGLLYFMYVSTKFPRYPCPVMDWCACNGNEDTCVNPTVLSGLTNTTNATNTTSATNAALSTLINATSATNTTQSIPAAAATSDGIDTMFLALDGGIFFIFVIIYILIQYITPRTWSAIAKNIKTIARQTDATPEVQGTTTGSTRKEVEVHVSKADGEKDEEAKSEPKTEDVEV